MHPKHREALRLRKIGKSYREIALFLGVAKSSVSNWCRNISLGSKAMAILKGKSNQSWEKLAEYNRKRSDILWQAKQEIADVTKEEIGRLSQRELCLVGAALYWGEGWKNTKKPRRTPTIAFSNSDPFMIQFFLRFLREVIEIPEEKIIGSIQIHPHIAVSRAIAFWKSITKIPKSRFYIRYQVSKASNGKRPHRLLPYGTLELRVSAQKQFWRIKGWINALAKEGEVPY